jgi:Cu+-exporting ATPase
MNLSDVVVVAGGLVLTAALGWFFFGPKKARSAELVGKVQKVTVDQSRGRFLVA